MTTTTVVHIPSVATSRQSTVLNIPINVLWELIRPCTFEWQESLVISSESKTGTTQIIQYKDKTKQTIQTTEISDRHHRLCWSMIASDPPITYTARDDTIQLTEITALSQGIKSQTLIEWDSNFSSDVSAEVIIDSNLKKQDAFSDLKASTEVLDLSGKEVLGKWIVGETLGKGSYSVVKLGQHTKTKEFVALKILNVKRGGCRFSSQREQIKMEIKALEKISHPNVIELKGFNFDILYRNKNVILLVLEYAPGGELYEYISFTGPFGEDLGRSYFHQLMNGLQAVHKMNICHRDLKPSNLLMDENFQLKIADFGLAHVTDGAKLRTRAGSLGFIAPEVLFRKKEYDGTLVDVWASGVTLFRMISSFPPYISPSKKDWWFKQIMQRKYNKFWEAHDRKFPFSEEFKDLINKMLTRNPKERISIADIMEHPWYQGKILEQSEITRLGYERQKILVAKNRKVQEMKKQKQEELGFSYETIKGLGDEFDVNSEELPDEGPPSILLMMKDDQNDNDEVDDLELDFDNFYEEDGRTSFYSFDDEEIENKEKMEAPVYNPTKRRFTRFDCSVSPEKVQVLLKRVMTALNIHYEKKRYTFNVEVQSITGTVDFGIRIFRHPHDPDVSVVECQRGKGEIGAYLNYYAKIRNRMDSIARKEEFNVSKGPVSTEPS